MVLQLSNIKWITSECTVDELKKYLRLRALKVSGRKEELVSSSCICCCWLVLKIMFSPSNQLQKSKKKSEYQHKLKLDDITITDPYLITNVWFNENDGMKLWPMIFIPRHILITYNYIMFFPSELGTKDLNDYKNYKAYSY